MDSEADPVRHPVGGAHDPAGHRVDDPVPPGEPPQGAAEAPFPPAKRESLVEEIATLIDDAELYARAELAFQKTRARLTLRNLGVAAGSVLIGLILLHIALIALAVGLVIALEPLVTIWGAIAIVVGIMLLGVAALLLLALRRTRAVGAMFSDAAKAGSGDDAGEQDA
jgi:hypothetical protein